MTSLTKYGYLTFDLRAWSWKASQGQAKKRGVTPDELFKSILNGTADSNDDESAVDEK